MNELFKFHKLNSEGMVKAQMIATDFSDLLMKLEAHVQEGSANTWAGREMSIVKTKLEEACFFAKKAMAKQPENQE